MSLLEPDRRGTVAVAALAVFLGAATVDPGMRGDEEDGVPMTPGHHDSWSGTPGAKPAAELAWAVDAYEAMRRNRGPATPELFITWVWIGERYAHRADRRADRACEELEPDVREGYARYRAVWSGFRRAQRALEPPLEACVLHALATHYAYRTLRALRASPRLARHPEFLDAFARYGASARQLGLESSHDLAVRLEIFHERVGRTHRFGRGTRLDPLAGKLLAHAARYQLERALERFRAGHGFAAENLVGIAVERLYAARSAGASRKMVRDVLGGVSGFTSRLPGRGSADAGERTLADSVRSALARRLRREARGRASLAIRVEPDGDTVVGRGLRETIRVRGAPDRLTRERWLLEELDLLVRQVAGEPLIDEHRDLARLGSVLFYGLLAEELGEGLDALERRWRRTHSDEDPVRAGRALVADPTVRAELRAGGRLSKVRRALAVIDTPEIWADLADLHVRRARAAGTCSVRARRDWRGAARALDRAWRRSHPEHPMRRSQDWPRLQRAIEALARGDAPRCAPRSENSSEKSRDSSAR